MALYSVVRLFILAMLISVIGLVQSVAAARFIAIGEPGLELEFSAEGDDWSWQSKTIREDRPGSGIYCYEERGGGAKSWCISITSPGWAIDHPNGSNSTSTCRGKDGDIRDSHTMSQDGKRIRFGLSFQLLRYHRRPQAAQHQR